MKKSLLIGAVSALGLLGALPGTARADFGAPRFQVDQKGDVVVIGNTLGFDCAAAANIPAPVVGTVGNCGLNSADQTMDVYWRADSPGAGQATADLSISPAQARTTAILNLPAGAAVTKAFLYWGARIGGNGVADTNVTLDRQGGFSASVDAIQSYLNSPQPAIIEFYQSVADITALVQANGSGAYRVGGINTTDISNTFENIHYAGWWMTVFYTLPSDPPRNLAVFDGLELVLGNPGVTTNISGFLVPNAGFDAKLGVVAFEGQDNLLGDEIKFGGSVLSNALNPANNFFNNTRSFFGAPVSVAGDLPQLTGGARSMSSLDIDVVDVSSILNAGQNTAQIQANTTSDTYFLAGFVTSITTFKPDFSASTKDAVDLNGGALLPGDVLEYTIVAINNGNDASTNTVLTDVIPAGVTYVPGSIQVTSGPNQGVKTDAAGDDQGEYDAATHKVTVRIGAGANAASGGLIPVGSSSTIKFKVTVDANASGAIQNQATITATGQQGAPQSSAVTDGNGAALGAPPTTVVVDQCATDAECSNPKPHCFTTPNPNVCVECFQDNQCGALKPTCNLVTNTCTCVPTGPEICGNNVDEDCDGSLVNGCVGCSNDADCGGPTSGQVCNPGGICGPGCRGMNGNGCPNPLVCSSVDATIGQCVECAKDADCGGPTSGTVCNGVTHSCVPGCRGMNGNGCPNILSCTSMDASIGQCVECVVDADCGGPTSGTVCNGVTHACIPGCRGMNGNGCMPGSVCTSMDATIGLCVGCNTDADCGGPTSAIVCDGATKTCIPGCRGMNGNGCMPGDVCTSMDATIGQCFQCLTDADCGGPMSAKVCDAATNMCIDGCRGMNGNGCKAGDVCTSKDDTIGQCLRCLVDADCGGPTSAKVCDAATNMCVDGCRGMNGNGCMPGDACTSVDETIGMCVDCLVDADCGAIDSAKVCDGMKCKDGCRGMDGNHCPAGKDCTSKDATIGVCVECLTDAECGDAKSGKVCDDATHMCGPGCRGMDGNGCPDGQLCSSSDATIGMCFTCNTDADCGAADSGQVCDDTSKTCVPGCRGKDGNGCGSGLKCTSLDATIGACVGCNTDADCGDSKSAKVCDDQTKLCIEGCRGKDGNGCPSEQTCSSTDATIGTCGAGNDDVIAQGDGIFCATRPGPRGDDSAPWLFGGAIGLALALRRRRRA
ncbi:MAG: DUF11 domain-containing protein [Byssovorax sp.]